MIALENKLVQNVLTASASNDTSGCMVSFSRLNKEEISLMKKLFNLEAGIQNFDNTTYSDKWSLMINSSCMTVSYRAQAQYLTSFVPEFSPKKQQVRIFR